MVSTYTKKNKDKYDSSGRLKSNVANKEAAKKRRLEKEANKKTYGTKNPEEVMLKDNTTGEFRPLTSFTPEERDRNARLGQEIQRQKQEAEQASIQQEATPLAFPEQAAANAAAQEEFSNIQRRELDPSLEAGTTLIGNIKDTGFPIPGTETPLIGGVVTAGRNILADYLMSGALGQKVADRAQATFDLNPEVLQTQARTEIEKKVYEEGVTASEKVGALIEGLGIGGAIRKLGLGDTIETPTGNVQELVNTIRTERGRATKYETWASQGIISPEVAQQQIDDIDLQIQRLESRIKLLTNYSPTLKYNSDGINKIEAEILRSREVIGAARIRAGGGQLSEADDLAYLNALQSFDNEEEFTL